MTENFFDLEEASKKYWLAIDALDAAFEKLIFSRSKWTRRRSRSVSVVTLRMPSVLRLSGKQRSSAERTSERKY